MNITPFDDLMSEAGAIQKFLEEPFSDEIESVVSRGDELLGYIARTGKMRADAKFHLDRKMKSSIMEQVKEMGEGLKLPASTLNELVKANCEAENYLFLWCERLNRSATHQLDWLRSLVSKEKEEMRLSGGFNNRGPHI